MSFKMDTSKVLNRMQQDLESTKDITFTFTDHPGHTIQAHKNILACASPVFHTMFDEAHSADGSVEIRDMHPDYFQRLIDYVYGNTVKCKSIKDAAKFYQAADRFKLPTKPMMEYLVKKINYETCFQVYKVAKELEIHDLIKKCEIAFSRSTAVLINSTDFLKVSADVVNTIFGLKEIRGLTEWEMCAALHTWLSAQKGALDKNIKKVRPAICAIRFRSIKNLGPKKLEKLNFLTKDEIECIMDPAKYPKEFSSSDKMRKTDPPNCYCKKCGLDMDGDYDDYEGEDLCACGKPFDRKRQVYETTGFVDAVPSGRHNHKYNVLL